MKMQLTKTELIELIKTTPTGVCFPVKTSNKNGGYDWIRFTCKQAIEAFSAYPDDGTIYFCEQDFPDIHSTIYMHSVSYEGVE